MLKQSFLQDKNKTHCSGCGACASVCLRNAINMVEDNEGFIYPLIDSDSCVNCGLCTNICPFVKEQTNCHDSFSQKCLAVTANDINESIKSATTGLATIIAKRFIERGGVVYGVELDESSMRANHIECRSIEDIERTRNSKYIQSNIGNCYRKAKSQLSKGLEVLFIGTPCQIAGLKSYLRKPYDNLYTIDLICHGTYSYKLLIEEVAYWERKYKGTIHNFKFRSKRKYPWTEGGMINFDITCGSKTKHIERHGSSSPTYRCYAYSPDGIYYNLRPSCYSCHFRPRDRVADMTIGDAWGSILENNPRLKTTKNIKYGISLALLNTPQSERLLSFIEGYVELYDISSSDAFSQSALNEISRIMPKQREQIYANLNSNYAPTIEKIFGGSMDKYHRDFLRRWYLERLKQIVKKVIFYEKFFKKFLK